MKTLFGWLGRALAYFFYKSPKGFQYFVGDALGIIWFDILRIRRQVVLDNLQRAFPDMPMEEKVSIGRQSICCLGRNLIEFCYIPFLTAAKFDEFFEFHGFENYLAAKEKNRGVCFLTLHLGNYDLATAGFGLKENPLTVISKEFKWKWLNDLWFGVRSKVGTRFIPPRNSSYAVLKALKSKESVVFVQDQFMGPPIGVRTQFFGHQTGTALGLSVMAGRAGAPVVPAYAYRNKKGKTVVVIEPEIPYEVRGDRDETQAHMTQVYTDWTERCIRKHPEQWLWVHRRWKPFRD